MDKPKFLKLGLIYIAVEQIVSVDVEQSGGMTLHLSDSSNPINLVPGSAEHRQLQAFLEANLTN